MSTTSSLSLSPWAISRATQPSLKDVLARVSVERGRFRNVTEASLLEEMAAEGALELSTSASSDEDEDDAENQPGQTQDDKKPKTRADLYAAKNEMMQQTYTAEQDVLMALDLVSMVQSREQSAVGSSTMSPALKKAVPTGVLGLDIWHKMPHDKDLEAQNGAFARTTRMESIQKSADNLLGAAKRLEENVRKETQYWDQVLTVSQSGWKMSRLPGQAQKLGVHYGFSEAAAEFSRRGFAALNSDAEGNVTLERGVGNNPKALHITLRQGGRIVGTSSGLSLQNDDETTLESRIRRARDSVFDEELFHEMIREARIMSSFGVRMRGSAIRLRTDLDGDADALEASFDLVSLLGASKTSAVERDHDDFAQAIAVMSRLLLTQAHRERLRKRTEVPAPLSDKKEEQPVLPILRPILAFALHRNGMTQLNNFIDSLDKTASATKAYVHTTNARLQLPAPSDITGAEALVKAFLQAWSSEASLTIGSRSQADSQTMTIRLVTNLGSGFGSTFMLSYPFGRVFNFNSLEELIDAVDFVGASMFVKIMKVVCGDGWICNERESVLSKEGKEGLQSMRVVLDSAQGSVTLYAGKNAIVWRVGGNSEERSIWDVVRTI